MWGTCKEKRHHADVITMDDIWYRIPKTFAFLVLFAVFLKHKDIKRHFIMRRILSKLHIRSAPVECVPDKLDGSTNRQENVVPTDHMDDDDHDVENRQSGEVREGVVII